MKTLSVLPFLLAPPTAPTPAPTPAPLIYCRMMNYRVEYEKKSYFPSPDKRYAAVATMGDGEYVRFSLYKWDAASGKTLGHSLFSFDPAEGFVWRPGKPHELIFSISFENYPHVSGVYDWNERLRCLKRNIGEDDNNLAAISRDGKFIIYDHDTNLMRLQKHDKGPYPKKLFLK